MSLSGFPTYIQVVLGSVWGGKNGLNEDTVITLQKIPGQDAWSENGTDVPMATPGGNRIKFVPSSDGFSMGPSTFSAMHKVAIHLANTPWVNLINANMMSMQMGTSATLQAYTFKEVFDAGFASASMFGAQAAGFVSASVGSYNPDVFKSMAMYNPAAPPDAPTGLAATETSYSRIDLAWDEIQNADSYDVEVDGVVTAGLLTNSYADDGLAPCTARAYRVRGVNTYGNGAWSAVVHAASLARIAGTVADAAAAPVEGAAITILDTAALAAATAETDAAGGYEASVARDGAYSVVAAKAGESFEARPFVATPAAEGEHLYWRLDITDNNGDFQLTRINEMELLDSAGGDLCAGGEASAASSNHETQLPGHAFDDNLATYWQTAIGAQYPTWIQYKLPKKRRPASLTLAADANNLPRMPRDFSLSYSDDGSTWTVAGSWADQAFAANEKKVYAIPYA